MKKRVVYTRVFECDNGWWLVIRRERGKDLYGFENELGEISIPFLYHYACMFIKGRAAVAKRINGRVAWGYIDETGAEIVPVVYKAIPRLTPDGKVIGNPPLQDLTPKLGTEENPEMQEIMRRGLIGFKNREGKMVISCKYDWVDYEGFNQYGMLAVAQWTRDRGVLMGVIDKTGKEIVPVAYEQTGFEDGHIVVKTLEGKYSVFDLEGNPIGVKSC